MKTHIKIFEEFDDFYYFKFNSKRHIYAISKGSTQNDYRVNFSGAEYRMKNDTNLRKMIQTCNKVLAANAEMRKLSYKVVI